MTRYKPTRETYLPKGARKVSHKFSDAVAYVHSDKSGRPCAMVFYGTQAKPVANYRYRSEEERERSVTRYFEARKDHQVSVNKRREEAKAFAHNVRVGDIFTTCWGYDQTNREAFEVIEVRGKFAVLREIAMASEERGPSDKVVPQSGAFLSPRHEGDDQGLPIRRLIQRGYRDEAHIKIDDVRSASPWGQREPVTGTIIGRVLDRTASGWGH
jgi:hypothetical protein